MMEFQPASKTDYPRSDIYIPSSQISHKVKQNLDIFINNPENSPHYYGTDVTLRKPPSQSKKIISKIISLIFYLLKKSHRN